MNLRIRLFFWIGSYITLCCELINIITFTLYKPCWGMLWIIYSAKINMKKDRERRIK